MSSGPPYSVDDYVQACAPVTDSSPANSFNTAMQIIFTTVCCTTGVWAIYKIWKVRQLMSVRQRAPLIAIVHILVALLYTALQIGMNIGLYSGVFNSWATADTLSSVSVGRYLYKFFRLMLRIGFGFLGWFRALVIWCQWQKPKKIPGLVGSVVDLLATRKSMWRTLVISILILTLFLHGPGWFVENSPTVGTWFVPQYQIMYKIFNSTTYRMLENLILLHLWWLTRNFPRQMNIQDEMRIICSFCILCNEIFELDYPSEMFIGLKTDFVITCMMLLILSLSIAIYAEPQTTKIPTLAELHHVYYFIGRRKYRHYFCRYLSSKHEATTAKYLLSVVKQFSTSPDSDSTVISSAPTFGADVSVDQDLHRCQDLLGKEFSAYRKTRSFGALQRQLEDEIRVYYMSMENNTN